MLGFILFMMSFLEFLNVSWNNIFSRGVVGFMDGLRECYILKKFDLFWNSLVGMVVQVLRGVFEVNEFLIYLDVINIFIGVFEVKIIVKGFKRNKIF